MRLAILLILALPLRALLCFAALASSVLAHAQVDNARLLFAISEVETGANPVAIGSHGERGEAQMMPAMRRYYGTPEAMLRDIVRELPRIGMPISEYTCALAWNCGITRLSRREIPDSAAAYARRVRATYGQ